MAQRGSFTWRSADETAERERCHRFLRNVLGITDPDPQATAKLAAERHERELQAWVDHEGVHEHPVPYEIPV